MFEQYSRQKVFILGLVAGIAVIGTIGFIVISSNGYGGNKTSEDKSVATTSVKKTQPRASSTESLQDILKEITPTGTPDYGKKAGVSYDRVEQSLGILRGYDSSLSLDEAQMQRYIKVGTTPLTACEFCCGIKENGFARANGQLACGCSHNIAFSGLTKWLIQNSSYTNDQIIAEIGKWKILFFPKGSVEKEARKRGAGAGGGALPAMRGGC